MPLIARELEKAWNALRAAQLQRRSALVEVRVRNLRGIRDLRVPFGYPVCVLAGPNGCGKSTVLFACACAYKVPGRGARDFAPSSLFPDFTDRQSGALSDPTARTELEFSYLHENERLSMAWRRSKSWNRSYMGRKGGRQPERDLYLRTLANLTNPSEVRGILQLGRKKHQTRTLTADLLIFAHRILRQRYRNLSIISDTTRDLLFAEVERDANTSYSEFHMSSGERVILRISKDISHLENALILIDEVDTGLHPYTQQQLMLELQRIALRQDLQIIVASHSPVILDSVPPEARVLLDRDDRTAEVRRMPPYRDIFQKALYGQSRNQLSILCEDEVAEGIIRGVLDVLNIRMGLRHEDFIIGRNTGKDEFSSHIRTLGKFGKLKDFVMVLDGDSRAMEAKLRSVSEEYGHNIRPIFLPGIELPERWIWQVLQENREVYAGLLGLEPLYMERRIREIERTMNGAVHRQDPIKAALSVFADEQNRAAAEIARTVGQREAESGNHEIAEFLMQLEEQVDAWRQL